MFHIDVVFHQNTMFLSKEQNLSFNLGDTDTFIPQIDISDLYITRFHLVDLAY